MKSYVISLRNRTNRLNEFYNSLPNDWPYQKPIHYNAIAGSLCYHPSWWTSGVGAWGCYKSHLNIIEQELNNNSKEDILIFEDDCILSENFVSKLRDFLSLVPNDADQIYLGGQHLKPPINKNGIYLANNINRTHCYIVTVKGLLVLYKWLNETKNWGPKTHIDHHYGKAHENKTIIAYTPYEWFVGQASGKSDICHKETKERWWNIKNKISHQKENINKDIFAAVIGLHRSGSSCTAMVMHKLGINMGDNLGGYENKMGGGGEAQRLAQICEMAAKFPSTKINISGELLQKKLKDWIDERISVAKMSDTIAGGKYPHMCAFGDQLINILGDRLRIIHCDRPLQESIDSLKKRSKLCSGWLKVTEQESEDVQKWLWEEKHKFFAKIDSKYILNIKYTDLLNYPQKIIENIISFLNIDPNEEQIQGAINHVKNK